MNVQLLGGDDDSVGGERMTSELSAWIGRCVRYEIRGDPTLSEHDPCP
jgi:hypothetical protein